LKTPEKHLLYSIGKQRAKELIDQTDALHAKHSVVEFTKPPNKAMALQLKWIKKDER
jgi:hypothetical protein